MTQLNRIIALAGILSLPYFQMKAQESAKDSTQKNFYYEQGMNCTQFVKQYLSFNESFETNMPYLITGNIGYKKIGLRYGVNYQVSNSKETISGTSNTSSGIPITIPAQTNDLKSIAIDYRFGIYFRKTLYKRLTLNIGLDYLMSNSVVDTKTENTETGGSITTYTKADSEIKTNSKGYGPCLALNFKVWKNISIGTEAAMYYISGTSKIKGYSFTSSTPTTPNGIYSFVTEDTSGKSTFGTTQLKVPLSLFVYFKF